MRVAVFLSLGTAIALAQQPPVKLLPTDREAAIVRVLQARLNDNEEAAARSADYVRLKNLIRDFIIQQLEASPRIRDEDLGRQLTKILGRNDFEEAPPPYYAFSASGFGPKTETRLWAVVYPVYFGFHGVGATGIVIDSYVWKEGKVRLAGRGGGELSGHALSAQKLEHGPDALLLLADGVLTGSSGSAISARAVLYWVDATGVHTVWQTPMLPGLHAFAGGGLITLRYVDQTRWFATPPLPSANIVEVWKSNGSVPPRLLVRGHY
jgi:hypothetical protein